MPNSGRAGSCSLAVLNQCRFLFVSCSLLCFWFFGCCSICCVRVTLCICRCFLFGCFVVVVVVVVVECCLLLFRYGMFRVFFFVFELVCRCFFVVIACLLAAVL